MITLACDTSNSTCCAGLYEDGREAAYELSFEKKTHSETFMPLVDRVIKASGKTYGDIDTIAVTVGPGSFTGIRIGLSAVKGLAYALNCKCIPVSSTTALARSVENVAAPDDRTILIPSFDARNKRVFASALYAGTYKTAVEEGAYDVFEFLDKLGDVTGYKLIALGDGANVIKSAVEEKGMMFDIEYAPGASITPKGVFLASEGTAPVSGAAVTASYCAVSSAERLKK